MKHVGHLDVSGNIALRGLVTDKLVTDGGFYSIDSGEIAYKSDVPPPTPVDHFYGIICRQTNYPTGPAYAGINTINFDAEFFYLTQNAPNTDEATISLRATRSKVLQRQTLRNIELSTSTPTIEQQVFSIKIPAGLLTNGSRFLKHTIAGLKHTSAGATATHKCYINQGIVFEDSATVGGAAVSSIRWEFTLGVTDEGFLQIHCSNSISNGNATGIGTGFITSTNAAEGLFGAKNIVFNPNVENTFIYTLSDTNANFSFYIATNFTEII